MIPFAELLHLSYEFSRTCCSTQVEFCPIEITTDYSAVRAYTIQVQLLSASPPRRAGARRACIAPLALRVHRPGSGYATQYAGHGGRVGLNCKQRQGGFLCTVLA